MICLNWIYSEPLHKRITDQTLSHLLKNGWKERIDVVFKIDCELTKISEIQKSHLRGSVYLFPISCVPLSFWLVNTTANRFSTEALIWDFWYSRYAVKEYAAALYLKCENGIWQNGGLRHSITHLGRTRNPPWRTRRRSCRQWWAPRSASWSCCGAPFFKEEKEKSVTTRWRTLIVDHRPGEYVIVPNPFREHVSSLNIE